MKKIYFAILIILSLPLIAATTLDQRLKEAGLVNVRELDKTIQVKLMYSTTDNFLKEDVYGELSEAYLYPEPAALLVKAQKILNQKKPGYSLLIYDAARPRAVQYKMWQIVKGTSQQPYVANPAGGSIHNFGAAVDLTIVDSNGVALDMGTPYDFFGDLAQPRYEEKFLKEGKLSTQQIANRKLLRDVMTGAGFISLASEWWHFSAGSNSEIKSRYKIIE